MYNVIKERSAMSELAQERINVRVASDVKREAESVFKQLGINLSDGINIYLRRVGATQGVPFPLSLTRAQQLGESAAELETAAANAVRSEIAAASTHGIPIARMSPDTRQPYLEHPDDSRESIAA
jgi:addiction module RelB/DinJ family antitoxin